MDVPTVGDWVTFTADRRIICVSRPLGPIVRGTNGIVLDYIEGGPEYPPCIVVAWRVPKDKGDGRWWRPHKVKPSNIEPYSHR